MKIDTIDLTQKLVQIDSSNPGAYEGVIQEVLETLFSNEGILLKKEEVLPGRFNIMAEIPGDATLPSLVYICHMDTVTLGEGWTKNPLGGEMIDGWIYGRGACDMKSGLACAAAAFLRIANMISDGYRPKYGFKFIGTVDEEDFMRGVEQAIASGWVRQQDWILDTEPTNGQIQVAHKGRTWLEIMVSGTTAHASTPWKGADAIAAMAEIIVNIREQILNCPPHHDLGLSTVTFGQIEGGYRPYVVPDSCKVWVDMRLVPPTNTKKAIEIVENSIEIAQKKISGISAKYIITGDRPYIEKDESSYLLKMLKSSCLQVTGQDPDVSFFPGYTDTAVIAGTLSNHNCLSYGPGNLEVAHKPDEHVSCRDIERCEEVLFRLAERILY